MLEEAPAYGGLLAEVQRGLAAAPKRLPPAYLYDTLGSCLFDAICRLPSYPVFRAECALLAAVADEIVGAWRGATVVELGPGGGEKLALLARALARGAFTADLHLVDVSAAALHAAAARLGAFGLRVHAHAAPYLEGVDAAFAPGDGRRVVLFLGSNLGNFAPAEALVFLRALRRRLRAGDRLLLGVDLAKPPARLRDAYDDPLGVTAAFNKNLILRLNRDFALELDPRDFDHLAEPSADGRRVDLYLVARRAIAARLPGGAVVAVAPGERILTESSHKFTHASLDGLAREAGFTRCAAWSDEPSGFVDAEFAAR